MRLTFSATTGFAHFPQRLAIFLAPVPENVRVHAAGPATCQRTCKPRIRPRVTGLVGSASRRVVGTPALSDDAAHRTLRTPGLNRQLGAPRCYRPDAIVHPQGFSNVLRLASLRFYVGPVYVLALFVHAACLLNPHFLFPPVLGRQGPRQVLCRDAPTSPALTPPEFTPGKAPMP